MKSRRAFIGSTAGILGTPALLYTNNANAQTSAALTAFKSQRDAITRHFPIFNSFRLTSAKSIVNITLNRVRVDQNRTSYEIPYVVNVRKETLDSKGVYQLEWSNQFDAYTWIDLHSDNRVASFTNLKKNGSIVNLPGTKTIASTQSFRAEATVEDGEELRRKLAVGWRNRTWFLLVPSICYRIDPSWNATNIIRSSVIASAFAGYIQFVGTIGGVTATYRKMYAWDDVTRRWVWALIRVVPGASNDSLDNRAVTMVINACSQVGGNLTSMVTSATIGVASVMAGLYEGFRTLYATIYSDSETSDDYVYVGALALISFGVAAGLAYKFSRLASTNRKFAADTINSLRAAARATLVASGIATAATDTNGFRGLDHAPIDAHFPFGTEQQWADAGQSVANAAAGLFVSPPDLSVDPLQLP